MSAPVEIVTLPLGPVRANAYLLALAGQVVVVDPGDAGEELGAALAERGWRLAAIWLTHAHFDHVGGVAGLLRSAGPAPVHMHPADEPLLEGAAASAARFGLAIEPPPLGFTPLVHGAELGSGGVRARVLHTPGHAPGHVAFHLEGQGVVLSGDALFKGSVGRTDLPFGDHDQLLASIRRELLSLPPSTVVLPGHGDPTTVGAEAAGNPFL